METIAHTKQERLEVDPVLGPLGQVLGLSSGAGEGRCRELEVGDITRGVEVRRKPSPVEESTKRNEHDVVIGVRGRQETVTVVGLEAGA